MLEELKKQYFHTHNEKDHNTFEKPIEELVHLMHVTNYVVTKN
jgi:hypothetical protein